MKQVSMIILIGIFLSPFFIACSEKLTPLSTSGELTFTSLTSDFNIAPYTSFSGGINFFNVSIASHPDHGFLVIWINEHHRGASFLLRNYGCRISQTGEMLDSEAIFLCEANWPHYCPSAVFAGGNWIICSQEGSLLEFVQAMRMTPSGVILDDPPVNICDSIGMATILYPTIGTNGQEILCVTGIAGKGLYGSIFDPDLNILVDRFLISEGAEDSFPRISANGDNFFITFINGDQNSNNVKLAIVSPEGQVLSIQNVCEDWEIWGIGVHNITTLSDTSYITYFNKKAFWLRRYSSDGTPVDSSPEKIVDSQDFNLFLDEYRGGFRKEAYTDLVWASRCFCIFWPTQPIGISMMGFKSDISTYENMPLLLNTNSQLCLELHWDDWPSWTDTRSLIRASAIGNKILTVWIDEREGYGQGRVYGNLFEVTENATKW